MNNEVTIDFNNGSFILENKALKLSASVSVPMLQNWKHFTTTEKIIAYLKKSVKGKKNDVVITELEASRAIETIVSYNKLREHH